MKKHVSMSRFVELTSSSKAYRDLLDRTKVITKECMPILILGEIGSGRSTLAMWIHEQRRNSVNGRKPDILHVDSSLLSLECIQSGLTNNGKKLTVLVENCAELSHEVQNLILNWIEKKGEKQFIFIDTPDVELKVKSGKFLPRLYGWLSKVRIPPIYERAEDVEGLVRAMLPGSCAYTGEKVKFEDIPPDFIRYLSYACRNRIIPSLWQIRLRLDLTISFAPKTSEGLPNLSYWRASAMKFNNKFGYSSKGLFILGEYGEHTS